ncbi:MAG: CAP domain-containing protein [Hydrogenimonas sp.]|nr:CAP domain-containing protein [Hydrogenimonas sp.]
MRSALLILLLTAAGFFFAQRFQFAPVQADAVEEHNLQSSVDFASERTEARLYLNSLREKAGLGRFYSNEKLEAAAAAHALYLAKNSVDSHKESIGMPGFTGESVIERVLAAGYSSRLVSENLSSKNLDYKDSIDGLFGAIYHRFGFLDPIMDEIGIAFTQDSNGRRIYVYDMGNYRINGLCSKDGFRGMGRYISGICADKEKKISYNEYYRVLNFNIKAAPETILWPFDGQSDVPVAFYEEIPDPLPNFSVSGYPISVIFNSLETKRAKVTLFKLYGEGDVEIPTMVMDAKSDPNLLLKDNQFAIFPLKRLEYSTLYKAQLHYTLDGAAKEKEWSFKTRSFDASILKVVSKDASFEIEPKKSYILYIEPYGPNDLLGELLYPDGVTVKMIDPHTFRIEVADTACLPLTIAAGERKIRLLGK